MLTLNRSGLFPCANSVYTINLSNVGACIQVQERSLVSLKPKQQFHDSHPGLPFDPDAPQAIISRPMPTDPLLAVVVASGAFFGTLIRYGISLALPSGKTGWPIAIFLINISGAFALGLLLQVLQRHGRDTGIRRIIRLGFGAGFLGAFTTYSTLAIGTVTLLQNGHRGIAITYAAASLLCGVLASALGIQLATRHHRRRSKA